MQAAGLELTPWRDNRFRLRQGYEGCCAGVESATAFSGTAASPLWLDWKNSDESYLPSVKEKWEKAAAAAKEVIDLDRYMLYGSYGDLFQNNIDNWEFIFQKRYANSVSFETVNSPVSYGGTGGTTPTLNLMEAYELRSVRSSRGTAPKAPDIRSYGVTRDLRPRSFSMAILGRIPAWETFDGGKDASSKTNGSKTGFIPA